MVFVFQSTIGAKAKAAWKPHHANATQSKINKSFDFCTEKEGLCPFMSPMERVFENRSSSGISINCQEQIINCRCTSFLISTCFRLFLERTGELDETLDDTGGLRDQEQRF